MLSRPDDLVIHGLVAPERLDEVRRVAARYSVALTPKMSPS